MLRELTKNAIIMSEAPDNSSQMSEILNHHTLSDRFQKKLWSQNAGIATSHKSTKLQPGFT